MRERLIGRGCGGSDGQVQLWVEMRLLQGRLQVEGKQNDEQEHGVSLRGPFVSKRIPQTEKTITPTLTYFMLNQFEKASRSVDLLICVASAICHNEFFVEPFKNESSTSHTRLRSAKYY
jgi:hypothetical protein